MPENRVISGFSPNALTIADTIAKQKALAGSVGDVTEQDYLRELNALALVPLLQLVANELRTLRETLGAIHHDVKFGAYNGTSRR